MSISLFSRFSACCVLFASALVITGCDELDQAAGKGPQPQKDLSPVSKQFLPLDDPASTPKPKPANPTAPPAPAANPNATASTAPAPDSNPPTTQQPVSGNGSLMEKAQTGSTKRGQGVGDGILTEPISAYFRTQDRITFEIQIPHQVQLWKAEHNNRYPRDAKEYIKEILEPCGVDLLELPPGKAYYYNANTGDLEVGPAPKK